VNGPAKWADSRFPTDCRVGPHALGAAQRRLDDLLARFRVKSVSRKGPAGEGGSAGSFPEATHSRESHQPTSFSGHRRLVVGPCASPSVVHCPSRPRRRKNGFNHGPAPDGKAFADFVPSIYKWSQARSELEPRPLIPHPHRRNGDPVITERVL
jgi:hypothetical protein